MNPGNVSLRAGPRPVCQLCAHILRQPGNQRRLLVTSITQAPSFARPLPPRQHKLSLAVSRRRFAEKRRTIQDDQSVFAKDERLHNIVDRIEKRERNVSPEEQMRALSIEQKQMETLINEIFSMEAVPEEADALKALKSIQSVAEKAISIRTRQLQRDEKPDSQANSASAILSLDQAAAKSSSTPSSSNLPSATYLSDLAEKLLRHPTVFITEEILSHYVNLQKLLHRPQSIPQIFHLYANKPVPEAGSSPPKYLKPKPKAAKSAIPPKVAESALDAAIDTKDLELALSIIDTTYCAPAFRRRKLVTQFLPPAMMISMLPAAFWVIAKEMGLLAENMDPSTLTTYTFVGLSTYAICTGTLGYVAITTANDQMERVTWVQGTKLAERWLREDERLALDKVAMAWGFKERWRRGEEDGPEWEALKEWIDLRGMILDKVELMDDME